MGLGSSAGKVKKSESFDAAKTKIQEKMIFVYEKLPSKAKWSNDFHKTSSCQRFDFFACFLIIMHASGKFYHWIFHYSTLQSIQRRSFTHAMVNNSKLHGTVFQKCETAQVGIYGYNIGNDTTAWYPFILLYHCSTYSKKAEEPNSHSLVD